MLKHALQSSRSTLIRLSTLRGCSEEFFLQKQGKTTLKLHFVDYCPLKSSISSGSISISWSVRALSTEFGLSWGWELAGLDVKIWVVLKCETQNLGAPKTDLTFCFQDRKEAIFQKPWFS